MSLIELTPRRDFDEIKEELRLIRERYFEMFGNMEHKGYDEETEEKFQENFERYEYDYDYAFIGSNDRIFPPENLEMNHDNLMCNNVILTDSAHYDASMFRFLLQDMWEMPIDDFMHHLKSINIE